MKIGVQIEWDFPDDKNWLNPYNIQHALQLACPNTKFVVRKIKYDENLYLEPSDEEKAYNLDSKGNVLDLGDKVKVRMSWGGGMAEDVKEVVLNEDGCLAVDSLLHGVWPLYIWKHNQGDIVKA